MDINATFEENCFELLPKFLNDLYVEYVSTALISQWQRGRFQFSDKTVTNCFFLNGGSLLDSLLFDKCNFVSKKLGEEYLPLYAYCRVYLEGCMLRTHKDNSKLEATITLNIYSTHPYLFHVIDPKTNVKTSYDLKPGDGLLFKGTDVEHYRDAFEGTFCFQIFLHYIRKNGPHANLMYDGRNENVFSMRAFKDYGKLQSKNNPLVFDAMSYVQTYGLPKKQEISIKGAVLISAFESITEECNTDFFRIHQWRVKNLEHTVVMQVHDVCKNLHMLYARQLAIFSFDTPTFQINLLKVQDGGYIIHNLCKSYSKYIIYININMDQPFTFQLLSNNTEVHLHRQHAVIIPNTYIYQHRSIPHPTGGILLVILVS